MRVDGWSFDALIYHAFRLGGSFEGRVWVYLTPYSGGLST